MVYTVIVLLVILIPRKRFFSTAASARFKAIAIGCALLSVLVFRAAGLLQMAGVASSSTAEGSRGDEYGTFYSLSGLVSDPLNTVLLFSERSTCRVLSTWTPSSAGLLLGSRPISRHRSTSR